jgi:hypothetical protein
VGGKSSAPPPPNYAPIAAASEQSAQLQYQLGQDQLAWARDQYAREASTRGTMINWLTDAANRNYDLQTQQFNWAVDQQKSNADLTRQVTEAQLEAQAQAQIDAQHDRQRYQQIYQPLEDRLVAEAQNYASDDRKALEMGRGEAQVAQQFEGQRASATKDLESFGVNPGATRFAALDTGVRTQAAAAAAGAGNQAAQSVDAIGRALRSEAINVGRGYPGQVAGAYGTSLAAGSGAINGNLATTASGANTMGTPVQYGGMANQGYGVALGNLSNNTGYYNTATPYFAGANNALGTWGNALTQGYNAQMSQYNANQANNNSTMSGIGSLIGLGASFLSRGGMAGRGIPMTPHYDTGGPVDDGSANWASNFTIDNNGNAVYTGPNASPNPVDNNGQATLQPTPQSYYDDQKKQADAYAAAAPPPGGYYAPSADDPNKAYYDAQYAALMAGTDPKKVASAAPAGPSPMDAARERMMSSGQAIPSQTFSHQPLRALPTIERMGAPPVGSARWRLAMMRQGHFPQPQGLPPQAFQGLPTGHPAAYHTSMWSQGQNHYAEGGPVPTGMSPSQGINTDDIPARLNAGEFVLPKETVAWLGEKHIHGLIEKAQKDRLQTEQRTGAIPDFKPALPQGGPTFQSGGPPVMQARPQRQGGIPMGVA